jgi:MoxR-like ATPase
MSDALIIDGQRHALPSRQASLGADVACDVRHARWPQHAGDLRREPAGWVLRRRQAALEQDGRTADHLTLVHGQTVELGGVALRLFEARAIIERASPAEAPADPVAAARQLRDDVASLRRELAGVVIGQDAVVTQVLWALFAEGHALLIGAPGLAKTLLARALSGVLDLSSRRIQFTPDLMPSDITGTDVLEEDPATGARRFRFRRGPVFAHLLLADEINRAPPKTQAALLEAMQERRVTAGGTTWDLPQPFTVLATQNPIEQEGTYPLPEAQLDRFMLAVHVGWPSEADEVRILAATTGTSGRSVARILDADRILAAQRLVRLVPISPHVAAYAAALARATRPDLPGADAWVQRHVRWGAGPRAGQNLLLAAKARALIDGDGSGNVSCADLRAVAAPVLRHRVFTSFAAAAAGISSDDVVARILELVREPAG